MNEDFATYEVFLTKEENKVLGEMLAERIAAKKAAQQLRRECYQVDERGNPVKPGPQRLAEKPQTPGEKIAEWWYEGMEFGREGLIASINEAVAEGRREVARNVKYLLERKDLTIPGAFNDALYFCKSELSKGGAA